MADVKIQKPNRTFNDWTEIEKQILELKETGGADLTDYYKKSETDEKIAEAVDTEKSRAEAKETELENSISAEETRAVGEEATLSTAISDEVDRATAEEQRIEGLVSAEQSRAEGVEVGLAGDIEAEQVRAEGEEARIEGKVDTEKGRVDALILEVEGKQTIIQFRDMPEASADLLGKVVQFIGASGSDFKNGYFYQCDYDTESASYKWIPKAVQDQQKVEIDAYTKTETDNLLAGKQDRLTAGDGIKITGTVIMADIIDDTISSAKTTWSSRYLESLFHSLSGLSAIEIVDERPAVPVNNTLYYVKAFEEGEEPLYEIWFYQNNTWTKFGTTAIDLTNYYTKAEVDQLLAGKQATLTEGTGIRISNNSVEVKIDGTTIKLNEAGNLYVPNGGGGGGGGFEPTSAQLSAMNSGITQAKREDYDQNIEDTEALAGRVTTAEGGITELQGDVAQAQSDIETLGTGLNTLSQNKADKSTTYTKSEVDSALGNKADKSTTYTKTEVDTALGNKLDKRTSGTELYSHSGATQGAMTVKTSMSSTPLDTNILTEKATKDYVDSKTKYIHTLVRYNNDNKQFPMGWFKFIDNKSSITIDDVKQFLKNNNYTSIENAYYWCGGCCGTTGVRNSADTGTAYIGKVVSGVFYVESEDCMYFKYDYNGTVIISYSRVNIITEQII